MHYYTKVGELVLSSSSGICDGGGGVVAIVLVVVNIRGNVWCC